MDQAMDRYADGDTAAFEVLYDQLSPRIHAFLLHHTRNAALAEDLLQQTFLQIHRNRGHFRSGSPVLPWALAIARRLAIDVGRRSRFEVHEADHAMPESAGSDPLPDAVASARQLDGRFQAELAKLPESQRTAFLMIREQGLSTAEAAAGSWGRPPSSWGRWPSVAWRCRMAFPCCSIRSSRARRSPRPGGSACSASS